MSTASESEKAILRKTIAARLDKDYCRERDKAAVPRLLTLGEFKNAGSVMLYYGVGTEPRTSEIIDHAIKAGKTVALPKVTGGGAMRALIIKTADSLTRGAYNIPEPSDDCPELDPDSIDFILVPGTAFDLGFNRLGRGGGYYDRFLAKTRAVKAAIAGTRQIAEKVPTEPHDVRVDIIITELGVLRGSPPDATR